MNLGRQAGDGAKLLGDVTWIMTRLPSRNEDRCGSVESRCQQGAPLSKRAGVCSDSLWEVQGFFSASSSWTCPLQKATAPPRRVQPFGAPAQDMPTRQILRRSCAARGWLKPRPWRASMEPDATGSKETHGVRGSVAVVSGSRRYYVEPESHSKNQVATCQFMEAAPRSDALSFISRIH